MSQIEQLRGMRTDQEIRAAALRRDRQELDEHERTLNDDKAFRAAVMDHTKPGAKEPDWDEVASTLDRRGHGTLALKLRGQVYEQRNKNLDLVGKQIDTRTKALAAVKQVVGTATPQNIGVVKAATRDILLPVFGPDFASQAAEGLGDGTPEAIQKAIGLADEFVKSFSAQADLVKKATDLLNAKKDGTIKDADLLKKERDLAVDTLLIATSQEHYDNLRMTLQTQGVRTSVLQTLPEKWNPKTTRATLLQAGMTAAQIKSDETARRGQDMTDSRARRTEEQSDEDAEKKFPRALKLRVAEIVGRHNTAKDAKAAIRAVQKDLQTEYPDADLGSVHLAVDRAYESENRLQALSDALDRLAPGGTGRASGATPPPAPSKRKVGDVVSVKGQQVKILKIHADGTFDYEPVVVK
jgi:hypothetical protein